MSLSLEWKTKGVIHTNRYAVGSFQYGYR